MTELEFILVTIIIVIFITFIVNKILTKAQKQKKIIPKDENFDENLNNLDKIIEGVALKENNIEDANIQNDKNSSDEQNENKKDNDRNKLDKKTKNKSNFDLKKSIIAKEIIDKKH